MTAHVTNFDKTGGRFPGQPFSSLYLLCRTKISMARATRKVCYEAYSNGIEIKQSILRISLSEVIRKI